MLIHILLDRLNVFSFLSLSSVFPTTSRIQKNFNLELLCISYIHTYSLSKEYKSVTRFFDGYGCQGHSRGLIINPEAHTDSEAHRPSGCAVYYQGSAFYPSPRTRDQAMDNINVPDTRPTVDTQRRARAHA